MHRRREVASMVAWRTPPKERLSPREGPAMKAVVGGKELVLPVLKPAAELLRGAIASCLQRHEYLSPQDHYYSIPEGHLL